MSEPLDLEPIRRRHGRHMSSWGDRQALLAEVERLRGEVASRDEQITEARRLANRHEDGCGTAVHAWSCDCRFGDIRAVLNRGTA